MEDAKERAKKHGTVQDVVIGLLVVYIIVFTCLAGYGGYFLLDKYEGLQLEVLELRQQIKEVRENKNEDTAKMSDYRHEVERREVLSSSAEVPDWVKGLAGITGPPGRDGKDGRDGRDAFSLPAVEKLINRTVTLRIEKEHARLSASLPVYGGSVYTRWGRSSCPAHAKLIFHGQMTGAANIYNGIKRTVGGGGTNYQCLPADPDLAPIEAGEDQVYNYLEPTFISSVAKSGPLQHSQHLPCAVCEAVQRVSQLSIPGKSSCPSDWNLEYHGYLMSPPYDTPRMEYVCIDSKPDALSKKFGSPTSPWYGPFLHFATAKCSGDSEINYCPPYKSGQPIQCVICTK